MASLLKEHHQKKELCSVVERDDRASKVELGWLLILTKNTSRLY